MPLSRLAEAEQSLLCFAFQHAQIEIGSPALFISGLDVLAGHAALVREYTAAYADLVAGPRGIVAGAHRARGS